MPPEAPGKKKKGGRLAFRIFLMLVISLLLGGSVYTLNAKRLMRNIMPMPFGIGSSVVLSGSMEPTLSVNDLVIVRQQENYAVGDVVVYQSGDNLIIHRIIELGEDYVITRGDANNVEDSPVPYSAVKGRMVLHVPYAGQAVHFLQSVPGVLIVIVLAVFLMNRSWSKEREEDDRKLDAIKDEIRRLREEEEKKQKENPAGREVRPGQDGVPSDTGKTPEADN